jgi:CxxC motif-containing protein (DUF1111 family)
MRNWLYILLVSLLFAAGCQREPMEVTLQPEDNEHLSGGVNGTTFDQGENAFGQTIKGLSSGQEDQFVTGNSLFRTNWVTAPSSVQSLDGLGPIFNAISCGSCHFKDGRAKPPATPDAPLNGLLFRLSIPGLSAQGGPVGDPVYGGQLQDKAILGVAPEADVRVTYASIKGQYPDGTPYELRQPVYELRQWAYGMPSANLLISPRIAPQIPGLGLLESLTESTILAWADENDADRDGISGRPNYVWDFFLNQVRIGRFGWKANQPSLLQQTAAAFNGDLGITTDVFPNHHFTAAQEAAYPPVPAGGTPELSQTSLEKTTLYVQALAVPVRDKAEQIAVLEGKALFNDIGCNKCHRPSMTTGSEHPVTALHQQTIWPYSDLLLHDMGAGLADQRPDFLATGQEWRTPPLWGIGRIKTVNGHQFLLHDGRANNPEEAILWHGGEAQQVTEAFRQLSSSDRSKLLLFLDSL